MDKKSVTVKKSVPNNSESIKGLKIVIESLKKSGYTDESPEVVKLSKMIESFNRS